jgi:predicted TIM-barrel fold metal-dependent hydrolase
MRALFAVAIVVSVLAGGCRDKAAPPPPAGILDAHLHLTADEAVPDLLALMDRHGVERSVILSSPNLTRGLPGAGLEGYREGNEMVLRAAAAHPDRLVPFITLDLEKDSVAYLDELLHRGACGVKLYQGHNLFRTLPLDDLAFRPLLTAMADRQIPVLMHVNTVHYQKEFENVLRAVPNLRVVCAHYCGAKRELDRLEAMLDTFPNLLFDTSNGAVSTAVPGLMSLEQNRDRIRLLIERAPERFIFGADLVTNRVALDVDGTWDEQIDFNVGILRGGAFSYWREQEGKPGLVRGTYRGIDLPAPVLRAVLHDNAARWLGRCLDKR